MQHGPGPSTHDGESASRIGALATTNLIAGGLSNVSDDAELSDDDAWHCDHNSNIFASDAHLEGALCDLLGSEHHAGARDYTNFFDA